MLLPLWAALGAVAALVSGMTIVVERVEPAEQGNEHTGDAT
jgi:hypothetical protein